MSQTTTFSLSQIPIGTDFLNADRGAHLWTNRDAPTGTIDIPFNNPPSPQGDMVDYYYRFSWSHFFTGTGSDSTINWSFFRARMSEATSKRMGVRFRIMANGLGIGNPPGDNFNNLQNYAGGWQNVPQFLHNLQQAEPNAADRDFLTSFNNGYSSWVPNTNSPQFRRWIRKFSQQLRNYIDTAVINGQPLRFAIRIYDLGYYGCYAEQHSNCMCNSLDDGNIPAGARPNRQPDGDDNLMDIVDAQLEAMGGNSNWKYVVPFNAFDAVWLGHTLNSVAYGNYLLNHPDSIGWIDDHIGANEGYDHDYLENNNRINNAKLMNRWRYTPIGGEPVGWGSPADRSAIPAYVNTYHMSFFGNGNLDQIAANGADDDAWPTEANNIRTASRQAGYRLKITGGSATVGSNLSITVNWLNEGNAPIYFPWTIQYLIKNGSGTTVSTLTSSFQPRYLPPSTVANNITQAFSLPSVAAGTYGLYVIVKDPNNYRNPMFLANTPRQSDGSYFLGNISLSGGGGNTPPIANAGPNQSIATSSATLNGTGSSDPDGTIASYLWTQVGTTPNTATIVSATSATTSITGLIAGVYTFNLQVTDNGGAINSDQVQITVTSGNQAPIVDAGLNTTICLPTTQVTVNATGSDDVGIISYQWTQISGPNIATIPIGGLFQGGNITGLIVGVYVFRVTVTDGGGLTAFDDKQVIVSTCNAAPVANAGANQTIVLPTTSVSLDGTASTDDNAITEYLWTQVGGPAGPTIVSPTSSTTDVTGLAAGIYIFRLRVADDAGLFNTDDVQITVQAVANGAPIANAGANQTITLPTSSVTLNSSGSTDDVAIVSRLWTKVSGPATFTIVSPTSTSTSVTGLVAGVYVFRITVTDGGGLTDFDEVTITVNSAVNAGPVAVAGGNQTITLPTSTASVDGSGSTDDVAVTVYLWTKVSGPAGGTISTPNSATTNITSLQAGTYVFRLRVEDAAGLFDTDDLTIIVNSAGNASPVAIIAGGAQSIQLPTNTVSLDGSGSTDDVAVTAYLWIQVSGPSTATIATPTASTTNMDNLIEGVYFFQLQVSDGEGLTDTDQVQVTVLAANPPDPPIIGGRPAFKTRVKFLPRIP